MMLQEEETLEMMETFTSLQQEVELKTKKLRRVSRLSPIVPSLIKEAIIIRSPYLQLMSPALALRQLGRAPAPD